MTSTAERLCEVSFYLKGEKLDPDVVSSKTNKRPTRAHKKGDPMSVENPDSKRYSMGAWIVSSKDLGCASEDINDHFKMIFSYIDGPDLDFQMLGEVDECFLDVFICDDVEAEELSSSVEFSLDVDNLIKAANQKTPIMFSSSTTSK